MWYNSMELDAESPPQNSRAEEWNPIKTTGWVNSILSMSISGFDSAL